MHIGPRSSIGLCLGLAVVGLVEPARAESPSPAPSCEREFPRCDYPTGRGCLAHTPSPPDARFDPEAVRAVEAFARTCDIAWDGPKGCYEAGVKVEVDRLIETSRAYAEVDGRALFLPEAARLACEPELPPRAKAAIDEAPAWCAIGRAECVEGLKAARLALEGLPAWAACVERMQRYVAANERLDAERAACRARMPAPAPAPAPAPVTARAPSPTPAPTLAPSPAPAPAPRLDADPPLAPTPSRQPAARPRRVVEITRGRVIDPVPLADLGPRVANRPAPAEPPLDTTSQRHDAPPPTPPDARRKGQFELGVTPFSGTLTLRDPATGVEHSPMMASVSVGVDVVLRLSPDLFLELSLTGRAAFASTAVERAISVSLDEVETETGTVFVVDLEPTVAILSEHLGAAIVADYRWDSIGVTSTAAGLVSTRASGGGGGLRFIAGFGLLEPDYRLVAALDFLFVGTEATAVRASIQGDIGPVMLLGAYRQHFRLGRFPDAYLVDELQLTLGYRAAF